MGSELQKQIVENDFTLFRFYTCRRVFSNCLRSASLAAAWRCAADCSSRTDDCRSTDTLLVCSELLLERLYDVAGVMDTELDMPDMLDILPESLMPMDSCKIVNRCLILTISAVGGCLPFSQRTHVA